MSGLARVLSVGVRSPLGLDARQCALGIRAGKLETRRTTWRDKRDEAIATVRAASVGDDVTGVERMVALAVPALREALETRLQKRPIDTPVGIMLALPEPRPEDNGIGMALLERIAEAVEIPLAKERSGVVRIGHAGGVQALAQAAPRLVPRRTEEDESIMIVGGIDTYYHEPWLRWLDEECRLHTLKAINGIIPSEAAAFACLAPPRAGAPALATVEAASVSQELTVLEDKPNVSTAMTELMRAVASTGGSGATIPWVLNDVNGERHRVKEWTAVRIRCREIVDEEKTKVQSLYGELGDVGAATALVQLAYVAMAFEHRFAHGNRALLALHSDGAARGVARVAMPGHEDTA